MGSMHVLSLASRQAEWLSLRQQVIAGNVANANTPGFRAMDLQPFSDALARSSVAMQVTDARHIAPASQNISRTGGTRTADGWETTLSGNSVSLEQEMLKAGEVHRAFALNTGIVKALDRMILASVKG